jgi:electron transport complex protein RnfB
LSTPPAPLAERIDALLPQTQCRKCGYDGCQPYAEAIAASVAAINRCPPGGAAGIHALARLTGLPALPLDPACGTEQPFRIARIDEAQCIGCTLCIQACPVDAISGAAKRMHTVIVATCTGCGLCIAPCPVDCIAMVEPAPGAPRYDAARARERKRSRDLRLRREPLDRAARFERAASAKLAALESAANEPGALPPSPDDARRRAIVERAIGKARARLADRPPRLAEPPRT